MTSCESTAGAISRRAALLSLLLTPLALFIPMPRLFASQIDDDRLLIMVDATDLNAQGQAYMADYCEAQGINPNEVQRLIVYQRHGQWMARLLCILRRDGQPFLDPDTGEVATHWLPDRPVSEPPTLKPYFFRDVTG